jgi:small subunit ribosomal protein S15
VIKTGRMYSRGKGKSRSHKPPVKIVPKWLKGQKAKVEELVIDLAKKYSSATIGAILRNQYGIPDVKVVTGKSITQIMKEHKVYPEFPEDLLNLFKRAVNLNEHLKTNKADKKSKHAFENLESKIRRLIKYYKRKKRIPSDFVYDIEKVKLIVQK